MYMFVASFPVVNHQPARAPDPGAFEHGVVGRIALQQEIAALLREAHRRWTRVYDEKGRVGFEELLSGLPANAAEAGDNDILPESLDATLHSPPPSCIGQPRRVLHEHPERVVSRRSRTGMCLAARHIPLGRCANTGSGVDQAVC
jgi:hypothetical protein